MNATIVSIFMRPIDLVNVGISPRTINIPACTNEDEPVLHKIEEARASRYILDGDSALIPVLAYKFASSIVEDFMRSMLEVNTGSNSMPGIIALEQEVKSLYELKAKYPLILAQLKLQQLNWKQAMVRKADIDWARVKNPALINGMQIQIARNLKLNKDWAKEFSSELYVECPACYGRINSKATICMHCKTSLTVPVLAEVKKA